MSRSVRRFALLLALVAVLAVPTGASATHSWGGYHWARTSNPFTVQLGDNVPSLWDSSLATAASDWTQSVVLNAAVTSGAAKGRNCRPTAGRVEVCSGAYGNNGWLGIASISITGGTHITQGSVRVNDTYFNTAQYNTPAWRALVMCQEVGHTFGLDHQDENFNNPNLNTCMDYTSDPSTNQHPNTHDYDELVTIYSHLDSFTTIGQTTGASSAAVGSARSDWGREVSRSASGHSSTFIRDLGAGNKVVTFVTWAN